MRFEPLSLPGAYLIELEPILDERGHFARTFCRKTFEEKGLNPHLEQCSLSFNRKKGTLRGMHFQKTPHEEAKLVRCTRGQIYDVIVDLRADSPTYRQWVAVYLEEGRALYVPEGFAHGFQTLLDDTEVFYQISYPYVPSHAAGIRWDDPALGIQWPLEVSVISPKDQEYPSL
ncbi:MAG: dTDP-4-dehydrorhamnose 3,5-epimerase [Verrucomicrobia bacterium]|nr:dTDP-4-dehydrorhamnose 3,5-epimerase [Verrucomicrobiota bacterium]